MKTPISWPQRGVNLAGALMFLGIFLLFLLQVAARYLFNWPLGWPDEAIAFLFVWVAFWGGALMVPFERQISFDLLHDVLPPNWQRRTEVACLIITTGLFAAAVPVTVDFIAFSHRQTTSVLELPLSVVYAPVLLFLIVLVIRMSARIATLVRGGSQERP